MGLDKNLIIIDIETSGTNPDTASIIQLGAIRFDLENFKVDIDNCFDEYVIPYTEEWTEESFKVHHISKETLLAKGWIIKDVLHLFKAWFNNPDNYYIAQWSCGFDVRFLQKAYEISGLKYPFSYRSFDIASFVRLYLFALGKLKRKKNGLSECAKLLGLNLESLSIHNALDDAKLTALVFAQVVEDIRKVQTNIKSLGEIL